MWWCRPEGACDGSHGRYRPDRFRNGVVAGRAVAGPLTLGNAKGRFDGPHGGLRVEDGNVGGPVLAAPAPDGSCVGGVAVGRIAEGRKEEKKGFRRRSKKIPI